MGWRDALYVVNEGQEELDTDESVQMTDDYKMNFVVDEKSGCWNWVGDLSIYGFPVYYDDHDNNLLAYLYCASIHDYGPDTISRGKLLLSCKNKRCVNPAHLLCIPWSVYYGQPLEYYCLWARTARIIEKKTRGRSMLDRQIFGRTDVVSRFKRPLRPNKASG
jgi:hypothetical protein